MALSLRSPDVLAVIAALAAYALWRAYRLLSFVLLTPLRNLPGPRASSWVYGNLKDVAAVENSFLPDRWFEQYGKHYVDHEFFMTPRLWTLDPRAIQHVLTHNDDYARPEENRRILIEVMGRGILFVQGEEHRKQRRILNPAFGPAQVRDLTEIFVRKSLELRDIWASATADGKPYEVNVSRDLSRTTLDVIGLAGFNYDFNALDPSGKPNELSIAFRNLFSNTAAFSLLSFLRAWFPVLNIIPNKRARIAKESSKVFKRVGKNLVVDMKESVMRDAAKQHRDGVERSDLKSRDLLTLLIKANIAKDLPASQRLSDADVIGQIPTFLLAGHETTSTSTTWALYALSTHLGVQTKLREELLAVQTDTPTMEELSAFPYLDGVVRETLRLHAPVTMLIREAKKDDALPVSEPYTDRFGKVHTDIPIAKGNKVVIPILAVHRSKELWGEDVLEFKPERWAQPPEAISAIPGVWGHLLTFTGGPRACIGYRFSLVEMKAILFSLIRAFEFKLAVPAEDIYIKSAPLQRPMVRSAQDQGFQLPLIIKPYKTA
ncbi:cytochrome P450 [Trametes elegans]|nr:cytochrome P450 [Trametes elegans]